MYIYAVHIEHFRSVRNGWMFPNPSVNVLLGPNNSGKTTYLRALTLVLDPLISWYREDVITRFDFYQGRTHQPVRIRVWLKPHANEADDLKARLFDKLTKWSVKTSEIGHPIGLKAITLDPFSESTTDHDELLALSFSATWNSDSQTSQAECFITDEIGTALEPFSTTYKKLLDYKAFPTRRDPLRQLSLARRSLLSHFLKDKDLNVALSELLTALEAAKDRLVSQTQVQSVLSRLKSFVAPEILRNLTAGAEGGFTLTFLNSDAGLLRGATSLALEFPNSEASSDGKKENVPLPLEYQGDGILNLLLLLTILDLARDTGARSIIALEEPEQNLEPALARWIFGELCSGGKQDSNQVFVSTHSQTLIGELRGADSLLLLPVRSTGTGTDMSPLSARYLPPSTRKTFERERERYASALFARHILVVEGDSELGFLPVAFRHLAKGDPGSNPFHLGLEIVNGDDRKRTLTHAMVLTQFGRPCHVLVDHDPPNGKVTTSALLEEARAAGIMATSWANYDLLPFASGADLETILVHGVAPDVLFEAVKIAYEDPGHPLTKEKWTEALNLVSEAVRTILPTTLAPDISSFDLSALPNVESKQAFLFALLHGPHSCKSVKDMRLIAEYLAERDSFPTAVDLLRRRIIGAMTNTENINHDQPYVIEKH